ncbi:hypothetical protein Pmani_030177 [Petrolisthes manimaculis]|uniref:UDP-D-xylose:beta-D-glucoside alpha-1,3-D-xylosyltransferase n=1 Tax=Petrolisthes manimaculis TaxID=1843537 RepID=A0AAE1NW28_9EUCA|nr:hypothetical protein Pmani_030177 [Petrolisthes manimaculis]
MSREQASTMTSPVCLRKTQFGSRRILPFLLLAQVTVVLVYIRSAVHFSNTDQETNDVANPSKTSLSSVNGWQADNSREIVFFLIICERTAASKKDEKDLKTSIDRQLRQAAVLFKSAVALSTSIIRFVVVSDTEKLYHEVVGTTAKWPARYQDQIRFQWRKVWYPPDHQDMRTMFRLCATERLFLPDMFPEIDAAIYVDTDLVFLESPDHLWDMFDKFDQVQLAAMAPCLYHYGTKLAKVPYYGKTGLNAGVMHMNLTRMKHFPEGGWIQANMKVFNNYKKLINLADQDILNILFHKYPKLLYDVGCEWNFRKFQCMPENSCPAVVTKGVSILHGNALSFFSDQELKLKAVFDAWEEYELGSPLSQLLVHLRQKLKTVPPQGFGTKCTRLPNIDGILTRQLEKQIL